MHRVSAAWTVVVVALGLAVGCGGSKSGEDSAQASETSGGEDGSSGADGGTAGDGEDGGDGTDGADGDDGASGGDDGEELVLNGVAPETPVPLPEFSARAQDGSPRGPSDLRGAPTVMWFYPLAASAG